MSRSNPTVNAPNPAVRWFEWNGEEGIVRWYDKDAKAKQSVPDFEFLFLDQLGSVRGWHDASESGIYSNEVRDTRSDVLVVKSFKGGTLIEGIYRDIKDRVNTLGGQFVASCYVAFKNGADGLVLGNLKFKGAALGAWMEFTKAHRADLYKKAIKITGFSEGKKGRIVYRMPQFVLKDVSPETNNIAVALDAELQEWLVGYFGRTTHERSVPDDVDTAAPETDGVGFGQPLTDDDIPF